MTAQTEFTNNVLKIEWKETKFRAVIEIKVSTGLFDGCRITFGQLLFKLLGLISMIWEWKKSDWQC